MANHVRYKAAIGYGESWETLRLLVQEILLKIKAANPLRITGLEKTGQLPNMSWVRRFAERHGLARRKCSIINYGRAITTPQNLNIWFDDKWKFLSSKPELLEAISDPSRVFNQDETAIEHGVSDQWVLAERGKKQVYQVAGSSTREHTTISYTISASGKIVPPRKVFSGV